MSNCEGKEISFGKGYFEHNVLLRLPVFSQAASAKLNLPIEAMATCTLGTGKEFVRKTIEKFMGDNELGQESLEFLNSLLADDEVLDLIDITNDNSLRHFGVAVYLDEPYGARVDMKGRHFGDAGSKHCRFLVEVFKEQGTRLGLLLDPKYFGT